MQRNDSDDLFSDVENRESKVESKIKGTTSGAGWSAGAAIHASSAAA